MANVTRRIGLSLGADICWPICYEEIVRRLDLQLPIDGDRVSFEVERVTISTTGDRRRQGPIDEIGTQGVFVKEIQNALRAGRIDLAVHSLKDLATEPVEGLTESFKASVLGWAGFRLRALGRLAEAAEPTEAGLERRKAREDWKNAAIDASNLSQLHLCRGDLDQALAHAKESVALADLIKNNSWRIASRTTLADALHQAGRLDQAGPAFAEAEDMQKAWDSAYPLLYSVRGYHYCDLLLGKGKAQAVRDRASKTIHWAFGRLLDIALDHLSLGRAALVLTAEAGNRDFTEAQTELNAAVDGLRQAGMQDYLPRGLLARAELSRVMGAYPHSRADLDEALAIAEQGGMGLHQADVHLEFTRLSLAEGDRDGAREHFDIAEKMVLEMKYGRRFGEVEALKRAIESVTPKNHTP